MMQNTLFVCVLCRSSQLETNQLSPGQILFDRLKEELANCDWNEAICLQPVRCMGACSRSCVVALAAPNKLTFILSELSALESVAELLQFSQQYSDSASGKVPYRERPAAVKQGIHAVLPPLPVLPQAIDLTS
ncbi:DUF1636 domain-containing protein [Leptolyngbya sp. FACHB-711]|uniref:DUF1636 domain-containing protein n=2 Tax=unclassified Leptolyngbya TaxID=2650499 RepID=UPI0016890261|nr:DUF1636 domain-containing protein [Leptolyngbya sp. FACHB-711]MBD1851425.1 DUF1636 domain-containing protein [Cyanobacteria bacterium FACHB-502]MBD2023371.1 DUF1636 domain-containing protein [Leptolyngbya sp. FACHB-711]